MCRFRLGKGQEAYRQPAVLIHGETTPAPQGSKILRIVFTMTKNIEITADNIKLLELVHEVLQKAASHMIQQNYLQIMQDLGKAREDDEDDNAEIPVTLSFKISGSGDKVFINPAIEWKRMKKSGDSMDCITLDPNQTLMKL